MPGPGSVVAVVLLSSMARSSLASSSAQAASSGGAAAFPAAGAPAAFSPRQGQAMGTSINNRANSSAGLNHSPIFGGNVSWPSVGLMPPPLHCSCCTPSC